MSDPNTAPDTRPPTTKRQWRREIVAAILALDPVERRRQQSALVDALPNLPGWAKAGTVLLYISAFPEEIDTAPLLALAHAAGKRVVLPRVDRRERRLRLHLMTDPGRALVSGVLGIPEPDAAWPEALPDRIDWALVPGVAFDEHADRLGRGAGYYDRLLPTLPADAVRWALCFDCQLIPRLPVEPHDIPLDGVTAPGRTILGVGRKSPEP